MAEQAAKEVVERPRYREFTVTPGMCGFKVKIGCSEAYFSTAGDVKGAIDSYLDNPNETEKRILGGDIRFNGGLPAPICAGQDVPAPERPIGYIGPDNQIYANR